MSDQNPPVLALPVLTGPAGAALYPPGARIGPRLLDSYELVLLVSGSAELSVEGPPHRLEPGAMALLQPGMRDTWQWSPTTRTRHLYVHFRLHPTPAEAVGWPLVRHWPPLAATSTAFRQLLWLGRTADEAGDDHAQQWWLGALLATVVEGVVEGASPAGDTGGGAVGSAVLRCVTHVRHRWDAEGLVAVSRHELAEVAGVSVGRLAQLWRAEFGGPVGAYLEQARLRQALPLLEHSTLRMSSLALVTGFADAAHFSHRFKQHFGRSPTHWRQAPAAAPALTAGQARLAALLVAPI